MPALVVAGEHDVPGFLAMSDTLASRIPGARYHRVPAAGHLVNMEQPGLVTEVLTNFLTAGLARPLTGPDPIPSAAHPLAAAFWPRGEQAEPGRARIVRM